MFYIEMQKEGLIDSIDDGFSLLTIDRNAREPPMKIVNIHKGFKIPINFIKFNHKEDRFITVGSDEDIIELHLFEDPSLGNKFKKLHSK